MDSDTENAPPRRVRGASPKLHQIARGLRGKNLAGLKFRFQHPIGQFVLDFHCASCKLVVELDGGIHDTRTAEDAARTAPLEAYFYRVIRFRNEEALTDLPSVLHWGNRRRTRRGCSPFFSDSPRIGGEGGSDKETRPCYLD